MLADLADSGGAWEIKGNLITFHSNKDVKHVQTHTARIVALQEQAHKLDLAIAHESDKADEAMLGFRGSDR